jgi:hypothetical protein
MKGLTDPDSTLFNLDKQLLPVNRSIQTPFSAGTSFQSLFGSVNLVLSMSRMRSPPTIPH